jgi:hypothetical protein
MSTNKFNFTSWRQIMKLNRIAFSLLTAMTCLAPSTAFAQSRPAIHWTTFDKQASQCAFHLFALNALRSEGLNQVFEDTGTVILAGNDKAVAEAVYLPGGRQIRLSVFSSDSATAAQLRNNVRTKIVRSFLFDTCP